MNAAARNGAELGRVLEDREGSAVLYRTTVAGPSGQRRQTAVARVEYVTLGAYELAVWCPPGAYGCQCDEPAGYIGRGHDKRGEWTVWGYDAELGYALKGWAASASVAADVLVNGEHAANGNHDSARISRGGWTRYIPSAALARARLVNP